MSSQALHELRAEMQALLAIHEPRLEGLQDLSRHEMSPAAAEKVTARVQANLAWVILMRETLTRLDALDTAGYPDFPLGEITPGLRNELTHEVQMAMIALDAFVSPTPVTGLRVTFDPPQPKVR